MRAAIFHEARNITAGDRPYAAIREPSDAVVRVVLTCVCGSDLWYYRGETQFEPGPIGHEFIGIIEDIGTDVTPLAKGDLVIAPFAFSDGTCPNCRNGISTACMNDGFFPMNGDGGQGEAVRVPLADTTLVTVPGSGHSDEMLRSLLTLSDVFATGHHAAVCAQVKPGQTVAVVGDGAVGLSGVLAAKRLGAERIIALSRHPDRQTLAREFGATDIVASIAADSCLARRIRRAVAARKVSSAAAGDHDPAAAALEHPRDHRAAAEVHAENVDLVDVPPLVGVDRPRRPRLMTFADACVGDEQVELAGLGDRPLD